MAVVLVKKKTMLLYAFLIGRCRADAFADIKRLININNPT